MNHIVSRQELENLLGDIGDIHAARIIATAADAHLIAQVLDDIERGRAGDGTPPPSPAYTQVRAVLEELVMYDDDLSYIDYATD